MAFIWKDKSSGTWYVDYTPPGNKRVRKRIGKSKQAANLALKQIEYQLSFDRAGITTPDASLSEFLVRYQEATEPRIRPVSWKRYRAIIEHFTTFLGPHWETLKLNQISREKIQSYVAWRRKGNGAFPLKINENGRVKAKTINTEISFLATMLNQAVDWGAIGRNPAKGVPRLKEDDRKPFRFFSLEEIELIRLVAGLLDAQATRRAIHESVSQFYKKHPDLDRSGSPLHSANGARLDEPVVSWLNNGGLIVDFLLTTGSRKDEVLSLQWSWLDFQRKTVSYRRRADWHPKGAERDIGIQPVLVKALKKLPRGDGQSRVFLDSHGKPIPGRTFERNIRRLIDLARLPSATIHDFRHTFASHLAMQGVPLPTIQKLMGHKNIMTLMIYAHLSESHIQQSVNALPF